MLPVGGANNRRFSRAENMRLLHRVCSKLQVFAHLQADRPDDGAAAKDRAGGVQKSDLCCTGILASTNRPCQARFLRWSAAPAVAGYETFCHESIGVLWQNTDEVTVTEACA
jgi:hypothetical protein